MTGHTTRVVVAIENKILVVVEACRRPSFLAVALTTVAGNLLVQGVGRRLVAALALQKRVLLQQGMIETPLLAKALHAGMITMARDAVLTDELLVKRDRRQRFSDRQAGRCQATDISWLVTARAALGTDTPERRVTGKAIGVQLPVARNQLAWPDHQMRIDESQYRQHDQIGRQEDLDDAAHTQPQNRKVLMIWPSASTAKTMKIGICTFRHWFMVSSVTASQNTACSASCRDRPRS